jgi:YebC/PmpR family DNA-binding regulatory protein
MGAQWKHAGRVANAAKRGAVFGKLVKEVQVAAKLGGPDPDGNFRLRTALEAARKASVPRDTIDRAIKKGAGIGEDAVQYETITFEGFAPHQVPLIVECLTDNRNRTSADIRVLFRKGQLGAQGAVAWMFDRMGVVEATHTDKTLDLESVAIEAGALNVVPLEAEEVPAGQVGARFIAEPTDLDAVSKFVAQSGWAVTQAELSFLAKNPLDIEDAAKKKEVTDFLEAIDDNDDVHRVYVALK